jgi:MOSC domain-containing protein YiiM
VAIVVAVSRDDQHNFSKVECDSITLLKGLGVEGDAHCGTTVKHRSRVKKDPTQPNLRQVHILQSELLKELQEKGFDVRPASLGENILIEGIDVLALPRDTALKIGESTVVQITGLRNPCLQLDNYQSGLTSAVLDRTETGEIIRKAGIMGIVLQGGVVKKGDSIEVELPAEPYQVLERV